MINISKILVIIFAIIFFFYYVALTTFFNETRYVIDFAILLMIILAALFVFNSKKVTRLTGLSIFSLVKVYILIYFLIKDQYDFIVEFPVNILLFISILNTLFLANKIRF